MFFLHRCATLDVYTFKLKPKVKDNTDNIMVSAVIESSYNNNFANVKTLMDLNAGYSVQKYKLQPLNFFFSTVNLGYLGLDFLPQCYRLY